MRSLVALTVLIGGLGSLGVWWALRRRSTIRPVTRAWLHEQSYRRDGDSQ